MATKVAKNSRNRVKVAALNFNLTSKSEVQNAIKDLGDYQRERIRLETLRDDKHSIVTAEYAPALDDLQNKIVDLQKGIQAYCESNRNNLTQDGKFKTVNFETGEAGWRKDPASVRVSKVAEVIKNLELLGLDKFIRTKKEVNKDAVLLDRETASSVAGISINEGKEQFFITPFEIKTADFVDNK